MFSLENVEKPLVLQAKEAVKPIPCVRICIFSVNPCARLKKTQKSAETIGFTVKNFRKAEKQTLKFKKLERERLVLSQQRIRALVCQYSSG